MISKFVALSCLSHVNSVIMCNPKQLDRLVTVCILARRREIEIEYRFRFRVTVLSWC